MLNLKATMAMHALLRNEERYELLGELASGGMATVYLARLRRPMGFSRLVAIKCMHPQFAKDPSFVSMFLDEARLTARLRHPNIVPTLDIVAEDEHLLLVMEYVEGTSLANLLRNASRAGTRIPMPIACGIIHDVLLGLHEAHQAKDDDGAPLAIVHRDVSPQNVIVGLDGLSRVLDFGVAKARQNTHHSNDNEIKGKIPYMPPEQLFGEAIDHKVDVYAAGVSLWEALVCERLFDGPSETLLVKKISEEVITLPSARVAELPASLDLIVMRALARDPNARYQSCLEMAEAIASVVPLPTRTEISAWVKQFVVPREIPSGTKLPAVAKEDPVTTILAILEKASMLRPSANRPAAERPERAERLPVSRTSRYAIAFAGVAFLVAGVAVAKVARSEAAIARIATAGQAQDRPLANAPADLATTRSATLPPPALEPAPDTVKVADPPPAPVALAPAPAPIKAAPHLAFAPAKVQAAPPPPTPPPADKKDCAIPFTIDELGHRHYKVECVR